MTKRMRLHQKLINILGPDNPINVYYQPLENLRMEYPAIVYYRARVPQKHADDIVYKRDNGYQLTVIDKDVESQIVEKLLDWPKCTFDRTYKSDNLNHTSFMLYE